MSYVNGGGARNADDKVFQHNGGGTVSVKNFLVKNVGKVYRSCGNCGTQHARRSNFQNLRIEGGLSVVAGVNRNFGDATVIQDSCIVGGSSSKICWVYDGNNNGNEPTKVASGPTGTVCAAVGVRTQGC